MKWRLIFQVVYYWFMIVLLKEYLFGKFRSAVLVMFPPQLLPASSLLALGGFGGNPGAVPAPDSNRQNS